MSEGTGSFVDEIVFGGRVSRQEFERIRKAMLPLFLRPYVVFPALVCVLLAIQDWRVLDRMTAAQLVIEFGPLATLFFLYWIGTFFAARWAWRNNQKFQGAVQGTVSAAGIEWNGEYSKTRFPWAKFVKARDLDDLVLVHYSWNCGFYFPRHFFKTESEWHSFKALLREKLTVAGKT